MLCSRLVQLLSHHYFDSLHARQALDLCMHAATRSYLWVSMHAHTRCRPLPGAPSAAMSAASDSHHARPNKRRQLHAVAAALAAKESPAAPAAQPTAAAAAAARNNMRQCLAPAASLPCLERAGQPVEALVQPLAADGHGRLNVPAPAAQLRQPQRLAHLCRREAAAHVLRRQVASAPQGPRRRRRAWCTASELSWRR